jgi:hypothetical protein
MGAGRAEEGVQLESGRTPSSLLARGYNITHLLLLYRLPQLVAKIGNLVILVVIARILFQRLDA